MWSQVVLCFLVGFAYASNNPAWNDNEEYVYHVRGRTLTGLMEVADQYTGILFRAKLRIQPRGDAKLQALITNPEYTQVHSVLKDGWETNIPEEELSWKPLPMSSKPFQMEMENGKITNLIVSKECTNWEANMIKSIVSLFQLNTNGENTVPSQLNTLPDQHSNSGVFLAMEDTVLGETETLYEIRPIPEYKYLNTLDSEENARFWNFKQKKTPNGDIIEVIKHEEFSNNRELPSYVFGFGDYLMDIDPATNKMGNYFSRDSTSRAILAGSLQNHYVLYSRTVNTILVSPTITDQQKGAVISVMEAELQVTKSQDEKIEGINQPVQLGNLVYTYNKPYSKDNQVQGTSSQSGQSNRGGYSYEEGSNEYMSRPSYNRLNHQRSQSSPAKKYGPKYFDNTDDYTQDQPRINEAPESPLLPYTTGYKGMSIKNSVNLVKEVEKIAKKIGSELEDQEKDHHEKTLERFVNLVSLIRAMDMNELKQTADLLHGKSDEGQESATCAVIRDAIAEAGTGPALLVIQEWIEKEYIQGKEASEVVATMANSARQPTLEYMKTFFKLIKNQKVLSQWPLNDTAILSFTNLARKVYIDKRISKSEYPVNSFGTFRTEEGKQFIREEVIPYLADMLNKAVQRGETHKIHAYTRATGNLPDPRILSTFEPFLEGKQQCSQFQRLLMVLSMGKLCETYPKEALSVFFRIYQNPAEHPAVRIAAVFHIMRSRPSTQILQIMATNTNIEDNEHVNSVVKYSIEKLTQLEGDEFAFVRESANAAKPLLTEQEYGLQYGANYLRDYVIDELNVNYKSSSGVIPSEDEYSPKGIRYTLRGSLNGLYRKLIHMQALVSSVDQLIDVTYKQTKSYKEQQKQQQQHAQEQEKNPWSSQNIAKLLNMKADEREQLEGYLYLEIGAPYGMLSFDNRTVEQLPEYIRELEKILNNGKKINTFKLFNARQMALAVPTAMGIPFLFTLDSPTLIKAQRKVQAVAQPQLSQNDKIQTPVQIKVQSEMRMTASGKTQGRVTFIAPFEHQQYISGFDKHWEINIPKVKTEVEINVQQQQLIAEIELKSENKVNLLHYRTWPYTAKCDVADFEPLSALKSIKQIETENMHGYKQIIGKKQTGIALEVEINHERKFMDVDRLRRVFYNNGIFEGLRELWEDGYIQNSQIDISYLPEQSSVRKITLRTNYDQEYHQKAKSQESKEYRLDENAEPSQRQKEMMDAVAAGINNVRVDALDTIVQFKGERNIQYLLSGAVAKSNVDPKSRVRICYKRTSKDNEIKDYEAHFVSESNIPNTNALDLQYSLESEPKIDTDIEISFGPSEENQTKIKAQLKHTRSQERKEYLKDLPMYKQCKQDMSEGNKQLYACTNMTMIANLLDRIEIQLQSQNLQPELQDAVEMVYEAARFNLLPSLEVNNQQQSVEEGAISMQIKFHPDLAYANISLSTKNQKSTARNIEIYDLSRETLVAHPVFHLPNRLSSHFLGRDTYRDFCTVDQTHVNTFSNRTYEAKLSKYWTVMAQYAPKEARQQRQQESLQKQLQNQLENYVILVRQNKESPNKEDVKIVVSSPGTDFKITEIEMKPSQGGQQKAEVTVNGKQIDVSENQSEDFEDGYIQVYAIPNGEVKVEVYYGFYVIYDGERVRMTAVNGKLKDAMRGLCGQFNDQDSEDFLTSENCIARNPKKFVKSFEVEGEEGQQIRQQFAGNDNQCVDKQIPLYVNVITGRNARRQGSEHSGKYQSSRNSEEGSWHSGKYHSSRDSDERSNNKKAPRYQGSDSSENSEERPYNQQHSGRQDEDCFFHQTKYIQENGEVCFTRAPMPSCKSHCQAHGHITKSVGVHCLQNSNSVQLWKNQIDRDGSPDFSNKKQHKMVKISVPENCSA